jgi:hypothetical protein
MLQHKYKCDHLTRPGATASVTAGTPPCRTIVLIRYRASLGDRHTCIKEDNK